MRTPPVVTVVARAASIALAVAAVAVLVFTALVDHDAGGRRRTPAPTRPITPAPASTMPGSIDLSTTPAPTRPVPASEAKTALKRLAGTWVQDGVNNYFRFRADGTGEWVAFGQRLWSGTATPRDATTFALSDPSGQGESYWQVKLVGGGKKLFFAGTGRTYRRS